MSLRTNAYRPRKGESEVSVLLREHLRELDVFVKAEHRFHPTRKWRFDWADIPNKLAFELEGGVFVRGRHVRPLGFIEDCRKYAEAQILGWTVFRFPSSMVLNGEARDIVMRYLNARHNGK